MISLRQRMKTKADIPTASMADIAFLLILFFMTTTIFAAEKGLKMLLPEQGEEVKIAGRNILQIFVNPDGKVLLQDSKDAVPQEYHLRELRSKVEEAVSRTKDSISVAIKISPKAPYSVMIDVLDEVKLAKAKRISLLPLTEAEGGGGGL